MSNVPLWWFQNRANLNTIEAWEQKKRKSVLVSIPTGGGKTITFADLLERKLKGTADRAVILVHRDELMKQTKEKLNYVWPGVQTGIIKGPVREYDKQITIASIMTLSGNIEDFIKQCNKHGYIKYLIIDEAHHSFAPTWRKPIATLIEQGTLVAGFTATPFRAKDNESLGEIFEEISFAISIFQLIKEGFLCKIIGYNQETSLELNNVQVTSDGDYNRKELSQNVQHSNFNDRVITGWKEKAQSRRSICFAVDIDHVIALTNLFNAAGANAVGVHGDMPLADRQQILRDYSAGKYNVLVNCELLTEGYDEPSIDCVLMARPTASRNLYIQMLGRGLRNSPLTNKEDCLLLDFTANAESHSLITMQDLLAFYGLGNAHGMVKEVSAAAAKVGDDDAFEIDEKTISAYEAANALGGDAGKELILKFKEVDVFNIKKFAWIELDGSEFVTLRKNLTISLFKVGENRYTPYLIFSTPNDRCVAKIADPVEKEFARKIAEVYLFDYGNRNFIDENAAWRHGSPSNEQRALLADAIANYKKFHPHSQFNLGEITGTSGAYSDTLTAMFGTGYITDSHIQRIDRDTALEKLKRILINEMREKNKKRSAADKNKERLHNYKINRLKIAGEHTDADRNAFVNMILELSNDPKGDYPIEFLLENALTFNDGYVKIEPRQPLTDNQKVLLNDIIGQYFRVEFPNRKLLIADGRLLQQ